MSLNKKLSKKEVVISIAGAIIAILPILTSSIGGMRFFYYLELHTKVSYIFWLMLYGICSTTIFLILINFIKER